MSGPRPLSGSSVELKKSIGRLVFQANSEILELQSGYKRVKDGGTLTKSEEGKEKSLKEKIAGLEDGLKSLDEKPDLVEKDNFKKYIDMMKMTVKTAGSLLTKKDEASDVTEEAVGDIQKEAKSCMEEIEMIEDVIEQEVAGLSKVLSSLTGPIVNVENDSKDPEVEVEKAINNLDKYVRERFVKIKKEISVKMREQITKLEDTWWDERDTIDYQGLKDIRFEFDQVDKKLRFLVNEWDKRKHGEMLTDYLVDTADKLYDEYFKKYTRMADEKRKESAVRRKKEQEIMEYN